MSEFIYGQPYKGTKVASYPSRRTCSLNDCATVLSIYNPSEHCSLHELLFAPRSRFQPKRGTGR